MYYNNISHVAEIVIGFLSPSVLLLCSYW